MPVDLITILMANIVNAAVVTSKDIEGRNDVGPVYDGDPIFPKTKAEYYGQPLFAVAATSIEHARKAVLKAKVYYIIQCYRSMSSL